MLHQRMLLILSGIPFRIENMYIRKDGTTFPVEQCGHRVDIEGQQPLVCNLAHDISNRKRLERERETLFNKLEKSLAETKILKETINICAWCKNVRNDKGTWEKLETYFSEHSAFQFSHGVCSECATQVREELALNNTKL